MTTDKKSPPRTILLAAGALVLAPVAALVGTAPAAAQEATRDYAIPAGPLGAALARFAETSGVRLVYDAALVSGRSTGGVSGRLGFAQALSRLLAGTGLAYRQTANGAYTIEPAPLVAAGGDGTIQLGPVRVEGDGAAASVTSDPTATEGTRSYAAPVVSIGRENARLIDIPQSVTVVTRQQIEDQNLLTLPDALRGLTGVTVLARGNNNIEIVSRGFRVTKVQTDGGIAEELDTDYFRAVENLTQYDHVELLRGSDGLFAGSGDPSGTVNLVRKRPLAEQALAYEAAAGRWSDFRGAIDVSTPLSPNLGVRAVASYRDRDRFLQNSAESRLNLYTMLEYKPSEDTSLRLGGSYERVNTSGGGIGVGLPRLRTGEPVPEFSRSFSGDTAWSRADFDNYEAFLGLDVALSDTWSLKANATYTDQSNYFKVSGILGAISPIARTATYRQPTYGNVNRKVYRGDITVNGKVDAFGRQHDILVGADYTRRDNQYATSTDFITPVLTVSLDDLETITLPEPPLSNYSPAYLNPVWEMEQYGAFAKANLSITDRIHLIGGGRYTRYASRIVELYQGAPSYAERARPQSAFTPYGGVVVKLARDWNAYFSYADIFQNQSTYLGADRTPLAPVRGKTFEFGTKRAFLGGGLIASIALYHTEKTGLPTQVSADTAVEGYCCYAAGGKQTSRGVDVELSGELLPNLQAQFGYTYNKNEVKRGDAVGAFVNPLAPRHLLKLSTSYRFTGALQGWALGANAQYQSSTFATGTVFELLPNGTIGTTPIPFEFTQGGYALVGLHAAYEISPRLTVQANVTNLFDRTYYSRVGNINIFNFFGEPRSFMLTLRGKL